jgi:hypothetical protein
MRRKAGVMLLEGMSEKATWRVRNQLVEREQEQETINLPVANVVPSITSGCHQSTVPGEACPKKRFSKNVRRE